MKKFKLTTSDAITITLFIIGVAITCYQTEFKNGIEGVFDYIKDKIMEKWRIIMLCFCLAGLVFSFLKIYVRNKIEDKFTGIESYNKQLAEMLSLNVKYHTITTRLFRELYILPYAMETEDKKEELARWFYDNGFNIKELGSYGIPVDITTKISRIFHEEEAKKLTK